MSGGGLFWRQDHLFRENPMSKPFHPPMTGAVEPARGAFLGMPLLSLSLGTLLSSLGTSIANVGLPSLAKSFEA